MIYVSSRNRKRGTIVLCFKLDHSEYLYEMTNSGYDDGSWILV